MVYLLVVIAILILLVLAWLVWRVETLAQAQGIIVDVLCDLAGSRNVAAQSKEEKNDRPFNV